MASLERKIQEEWEKYQKENQNSTYPNILLLGISGAGKSSLINTIFGRKIANVSDVRPETANFEVYKGEDYNLNVNLIDSAGYELSQADTYYSNIQNILNNGTCDLKNIHIIWYCLSVANERIEDMDLKTLERLFKEDSIKQRVCIVFTKCDQDDETGSKANKLKDIIKKEVRHNFKCFETSNNPAFPLQLNDMVEWSAKQFDDDDLRNMFVASQMIDIEAKERAAANIINIAAAAASTAGATPIPIADAALLVPIQLKMINDIINVYGLKKVISMNSGVVVDLVMTQLGKSLVKSIMKFIPVIGQIAGSVINAIVAGSLTYALGMAVSYVCKDSLIKALKGEPVIWENIFDLEQLLPLIKEFENKKNDNK